MTGPLCDCLPQLDITRLCSGRGQAGPARRKDSRVTREQLELESKAGTGWLELETDRESGVRILYRDVPRLITPPQ